MSRRTLAIHDKVKPSSNDNGLALLRKYVAKTKLDGYGKYSIVVGDRHKPFWEQTLVSSKVVDATRDFSEKEKRVSLRQRERAFRDNMIIDCVNSIAMTDDRHHYPQECHC